MRKQNLERRATSSLRWAERVSSTLSLMLGLLPNFGVTITVHKTYPKIRIPSTVQNEQVYAPGLPIYSGEKGEEKREERREKREERRQRRVWIGFVLELWELWKMGDDAIGTWEMKTGATKPGMNWWILGESIQCLHSHARLLVQFNVRQTPVNFSFCFGFSLRRWFLLAIWLSNTVMMTWLICSGGATATDSRTAEITQKRKKESSLLVWVRLVAHLHSAFEFWVLKI